MVCYWKMDVKGAQGMKKWLARILTAIMLSSLFMFMGCESPLETQGNIGSVGENKAAFYLLKPTTGSQMMGIVIQTANKKTIVVDGGTRGDSKQLRNFIKQGANGHIDAWFFTHPHQDHLGAFCDMFDKKITVDKIYHHFPSMEELVVYGYRNDDELKIWQIATAKFEGTFKNQVQIVQAGDVFYVDEIKITVLRIYNPTTTANFVNNSSVVYRIENAETSFLILGDLGEEGGKELMENCPLELLQTDYTQMAHHGQAGVSKEFYAYIHPKRCIWPTPAWLWDNDNGDGFDTGPWVTVRTREWMEELGVIEHWVAKDGIQVIAF